MSRFTHITPQFGTTVSDVLLDALQVHQFFEKIESSAYIHGHFMIEQAGPN